MHLSYQLDKQIIYFSLFFIFRDYSVFFFNFLDVKYLHGFLMLGVFLKRCCLLAYHYCPHILSQTKEMGKKEIVILPCFY